MKISTSRNVRGLLAASAITMLLSSALSGATLVSSQDVAAQRLARDGGVIVAAAGSFVALGTFRVQVSHKLGRADLILADGTWLYHRHRITDSAAEGTLVVRFKEGRVSSLTLVTPATIAIVLAEEQRLNPSKKFAAKK